MLKSFEVVEPVGTRFSEGWDDILKFQNDQRPAPLVLILRILSGNVDIIHISSGKRRKCRTVYFTERPAQSRRSTYPGLLAAWMSEDTTASDVIRYLRHARNVNHTFYAKIAAEICFCLNGILSGNHISSFVNIYRLVEWTSFAFPNIYFSSSDDFLESYNQIKQMMQDNPNGGELSFIRKSIGTLFAGDPSLDYKYDFIVPSLDLDVCTSLIGQIKHMCDGNRIPIDMGLGDNAFSIKFSDMPSFIITLRNRYFHYDASGRQNIDIDRIHDVDILFSMITEQCLRWYSTVLLKIVARSVGFYASIIAREAA